ncbi:hypothetical protein LTR84_005406 [Exophiala bonariae]|uniref:Uncharacterized protein n=1 Tax=Exophiala bonariae TaxID=1690606 RepID=A0AAV9N7V2_9EURO|nr:hypothetical protein LTR84_005406 [Exophiala bonariae]
MGISPLKIGPLISKLLLAFVYVTAALALLAEAIADIPIGVTPITLSSAALPSLPLPNTFNRGSHQSFSSGAEFSVTPTNISTQIEPIPASLNSSSIVASTQGSTSIDNSVLSSVSNSSSEPAELSNASSTTFTRSVEILSAASDTTASTKATSTTTITITASGRTSLASISYTSTETQTVTRSWKKTEHVTMTVTEASSLSSLDTSTPSTGSRPSVLPFVLSSSAASSVESSTNAGFFKPTGLNNTSTTDTQPDIMTAPSFSVPTFTDNIVFSTSSSVLPFSAPTNMATTTSEPSIVTAAPDSSSAPFPNNNYTTFWESYSSWMSAHATESGMGSGSSPSLFQPPLLNTSQAVTTSHGSSSPPVVVTTSHPPNLTYTSSLPSGVWISFNSQGVPFSVSSYISAGKTFQTNLGVITTTCIPTTTMTAAPAGTVSATRVFLQCGPGRGPQVTESIDTGTGMSSTQVTPPKSSTTSPSIQVTAPFPPPVISSSTPLTTRSCTLAAAVCILEELSTMNLAGPSTAAARNAGMTSGVVADSKVPASVPTTFSTSTVTKRGLGRGTGFGKRVDDGKRALGRLFWV